MSPGVWMRALVDLVVDGSTYEQGGLFQVDACRAGDFRLHGMADYEPDAPQPPPRRRRSTAA